MGLGDMLARAAKVSLINKQIAELDDLVAEARSIKVELKNSDMALNNTLLQWTSRYRAFQASPMSEVVVVDKFEGESAERIRAALPSAIEEMEATQAATESVQGEIDVQITKLDEYIDMLGEKIAALRSEMAAL
ncbi:MAG: hypothetical protein NC302_11065 [Bacteroidales bacterium]|nr:hypothetical protein [Bacteroidales bacterium]MCM1415280.1 hypothetical protein [bacterium]